MNPSREELLFGLALMKPAAERAAWLDRECLGDPALRQRLEALMALEAENQATAALNSNATGVRTEKGTTEVTATLLDETAVTEGPGTVIGRYKLLEQIGEGGFGVVYVAEQQEPVRRQVALKIIKLGMDTRQVVARFEAERQALALMDYPNIAKVFDAGATNSGRPYFVMELVKGIPITSYCDQKKLATRERLDLFIPVCQAIQHAHQKGIIHRDIKPSNILVTVQEGRPVPKVIDFGIAKATQQRLTEKTLHTQLQQFIGTPAYMSPEQAEMSGLDIDTRSDIYSLGVLLYELLAGSTPFDAKELMASGIDAMRKTIREKEPVRPSTRLATLKGEELTTTKRGSADTSKLMRQLKGDLDWIVMKCLEKDRTRRYDTANGLAMDLKRHMNNEPVVARPPSKVYEFQKSVRRHKVGFAATAAIIVVLAAGIMLTTWQAMRATNAKREALAARQQAVANAEKAVEAQANEAKQKAAAQQGLYGALVGQARATRLARGLGYGDRVFDLLKQAKALDVPQKDLPDMRNEAAACLGDFVGLTPTTFTNFPSQFAALPRLAPSGKLAAFAWSDGTIQLLEMPSGKVIVRLAGTNALFDDIRFNSSGDQLFVLCGPPVNRPSLLPNLARRQLYAWACDADGRWRETENGPLPGADGLLNVGAGMCAKIVDIVSSNSGDAGSAFVRFRLLNLETRAFVPGYEVTNTLPPRWIWLEFSTPDGRLLAVETADTQNLNSPLVANLYDWTTGRQINQLHLPAIGSVNLSPDGKYLAWLSLAAGGAAIYTVPGLERIGQFKENFLMFGAAAVFSRNRVALPIFQQNRIRLWDLATGENIALLDEPEPSTPVSFSPDGNCLLTIGEHHARFYRLDTPGRLDLPSRAAAVPGIAFSPDGMSLASVGRDRVVQVCDSMTGRILWQTNDLPGAGQCVGYSPDGQWLITGDFDTGLVEVRDARIGRRLLQLGTNRAQRTWSAQFSPDGHYLVTVGDGVTRTRIYKVENDKTGDNKNGSLGAKLANSSSVGRVNLVFASDGRSLAFVDVRGFLFLWDLDKSSQPQNLEFRTPEGVQMESFTPDGHLLAIDLSGRIVTLEIPTGKEVSSFQARKPSDYIPVGICLCPDGSKLAVNSESQRGVDIWAPKTGERLYSLPDEPGTLYWLAWSPDSRRLAIARDNGNIAIWNLDTVGQILTKLGLYP